LSAANVCFTARGAGTGLSAGALVPKGGVIIGLNRLNKIIEVDPASRLVVVEPGVVNARISQHVAKHGLRYAPDPASQSVCTIRGDVKARCLEESEATHVLSSNSGCRMQIDAHLRFMKSEKRTEHPLRLLSFSLGIDEHIKSRQDCKTN
jgi:hypothetical protein